MSAARVEVLPAGRHSEWDQWLRTARGSNFKQSSSYHAALARFGYEPAIVASMSDGAPIAGASVGLRRVPLTPWRFAHASGGIAISAECDPVMLRQFLEGLRGWCSEQGAVALEVSLRLSPDDNPNSTGSVAREVLTGCGFEKTETLATYLIDLGRTDDETLIASFGPNPRRHIRRARRDGLEVERSEDPRDFDAFQIAHTAMCRRKGMNALPGGFARDILLPAARVAAGDLFVARFRGTARNYLYVGRVGTPVYNWGAVADAAWAPGCPPTGQALHFTAMSHYRQLGFPFYDFGGTPGPVPDPADPNYTVWRFKHEFQGRYVEFAGIWMATIHPTGAEVLRIARDGIDRMRNLGRLNSIGASATGRE